jgi:hypothetical protein
MKITLEKLKRLVQHGHIRRVPSVLKNVAKVPKSQKEWKQTLKAITEAFYKRFWFYNPLKCSNGSTVRRPVMNGHTEVYTCPNGKVSFKRFIKPVNFFKHRYGRGGEFAQGLFAVLKFLGVRCRLVIGYWQGANALWVEACNPYTKRWVSLDPAYVHGYGHKFPRRNMTRVLALENVHSQVVNRSKYYYRQ